MEPRRCMLCGAVVGEGISYCYDCRSKATDSRRTERIRDEVPEANLTRVEIDGIVGHGTVIDPSFKGDASTFVPDRLQANGYRVLRLSVNATLSEIHQAAVGMRRAALLGIMGPAEDEVPALGPIPRTEADVRTALGRLGNPAQRLTDRLFWFHRQSCPQDPAQPGSKPVVRSEWDETAGYHDRALHGLFGAFSAGFHDAGVAVWVQALREWHGVVSDDDYWALSLAVEEVGAFEPAALPSEVDALRDGAVGLAAEPLVGAARDALAREDTSTASRIMGALDELVDTGLWVATAKQDIASPAVERVRALCRTVNEELASKVVREQDAGERNKEPCDTALERFRSEIEPALDRVLRLVDSNHEAAQQSREEAARCLSEIATHYTWADDFITSEKLREEALSLARDTLGTIRIEEGLAQIREAARQQRLFGALTPISSAPSLRTINGFGFALYGNSDFDPATHSYATTYYFVALFVPIFPIGRYRVISVGQEYRFLGKLPLRKADRWHLGIAAPAIVALILGGIISSSQNPSSSSVPATSSDSGYTTGAQRSELADLKAQIESGRSRSAMLKTQLQPVIDELTSLNARIEALAAELKRLAALHKSGLEIDIDDYNARVETHNSLLSRHRALIATNRSDLQTYEDLEKQDSALVERYNALVGSSR